jgi:L-idonate 5-dehydrogenase
MIRPSDVLLKVHTVGICGSDIEYYVYNRCGAFVPRGPLVLGHELSGEVVEKGAEVTGLACSTRVVIDPSIPCCSCEYCRAGRHNLCDRMRFIGTAASYPPISGGMGEFVAVPAVNCHLIPEHISWGEATCLEPLSVAVHATLRAGSLAGARVFISGGGIIGQSVALTARALGAAAIAVSDIQPFRRAFAVEHGADYAIDPRNADEIARAQKASGGFDFLFESSGATTAVRDSLIIVKKGATIVQIGTVPSEVTLMANLIMIKELRVLGSFRYGDVFPISMSLLASRRVDVRPLISVTLPYDRSKEAFELASERSNTIKVQIQVGG